MLKTCLLPFAVLCFLAAVLNGETPVYQLYGCDWIDDNALQRHFAQNLGELEKNGKTVDAAELSEQLDRTYHELKLPPPSQRTVKQEDLYEKVKRGVVLIGFLYKCGRCDNWHVNVASGFVVTRDGVIATNHHVMENKESHIMGVMTFEGDVFAIQEILASNEQNDTALIRVDAENLQPLPLKADAPVGSAVNVISHPDEQLFMFTRGVISRYFRHKVRGGERVRMSITADFAKGSSGAPVIDDTGAVVGMVSSTQSIYYNKKEGHAQNLQMVVKACVPARNILKLCRPEY